MAGNLALLYTLLYDREYGLDVRRAVLMSPRPHPVALLVAQPVKLKAAEHYARYSCTAYGTALLRVLGGLKGKGLPPLGTEAAMRWCIAEHCGIAKSDVVFLKLSGNPHQL